MSWGSLDSYVASIYSYNYFAFLRYPLKNLGTYSFFIPIWPPNVNSCHITNSANDLIYNAVCSTPWCIKEFKPYNSVYSLPPQRAPKYSKSLHTKRTRGYKYKIFWAHWHFKPVTSPQAQHINGLDLEKLAKLLSWYEIFVMLQN